ncbi:MAG: KilA-N domain-containing protein [Symploca sp. SIO2E6]|nr:KilA-N domain-containing protein [Symploca sp. SIO2E6]
MINTTTPAPKLSVKSTRKLEQTEEFEQLELFEWTLKDPALESRNIPGSQVRRRNGLISLTDMWRVSGSAKSRAPSPWLRQQQTRLLVKSLQSQFLGEIAYSKRGKNGGTFAIDELAFKYWEYLNSGHRVRLTEKSVQKRLAKILGQVQREVQTLAGNIDLLTERELIEVKSIKSWKFAVGQVLIYGQSYPNHQKRIHLFGEATPDFLSMIRSYCTPLDIEVTWEV